MQEPQFKPGDKAVYSGLRVEIQSNALHWANPDSRPGYVYQVHYIGDVRQRPRSHMAHEESLTRAERWEPCPGKHRHRVTQGTCEAGDMQRLAGSER